MASPSSVTDPLRHVYREYNSDADSLANQVVDQGDAHGFPVWMPHLLIADTPKLLFITFDGASRGNPGVGASAAILWRWRPDLITIGDYGCQPGTPDADARWAFIGRIALHWNDATSVKAELFVLKDATDLLVKALNCLQCSHHEFSE